MQRAFSTPVPGKRQRVHTIGKKKKQEKKKGEKRIFFRECTPGGGIVLTTTKVAIFLLVERGEKKKGKRELALTLPPRTGGKCDENLSSKRGGEGGEKSS